MKLVEGHKIILKNHGKQRQWVKSGRWRARGRPLTDQNGRLPAVLEGIKRAWISGA